MATDVALSSESVSPGPYPQMGHLGGHSPPKMLAANTREAGKVEMAAQQRPLPGHWLLLTEGQESHLQKG